MLWPAMNKPIQRVPVHSSYVKSIGYDPASQVMHVEFDGGKVFHYDGVPPEAHLAFRNSDSIGKHFHANIKGKFSHKMI